MKKIQSILTRLIPPIGVVLLAAGCSFGGHSATPAPISTSATAGQNLTGRYEFPIESVDHAGVYIFVTVHREQGGLALDFHAANTDRTGAAPDGTGTGTVDTKGVFHFTYTDSFNNRGTGTFRKAFTGYELSIHITRVGDSRCLVFYGKYKLQRTTIHDA